MHSMRNGAVVFLLLLLLFLLLLLPPPMKRVTLMAITGPMGEE